MLKKIQHIHFVGIGGIGMSGIAEVLLNLGYEVSGSDLKSSAMTKRLKKLGARVYYGHEGKNIEGAHVVVCSSAVKSDNPEVKSAHQKGIPVIPRAEMLSELMRLKYSLCVAGTHGKTTTTSMLAHILAKVGFDPTVIVGGKVNTFNSNAKLGKGEFMVAEADESDRSFLKLTPTIAVITNIDPEHMENYKDFDDVMNAYVSYGNKVPFYGTIVACMDHDVVKKIIPRFERRVVTYGINSKDADWQAKNITQQGLKMCFEVFNKGIKLGDCEISVPGKHHVCNALASIAAASELEIQYKKIGKALKSFKGIQRRFTQISRNDSPLIIDDYGHHPVEIRGTIKAARKGWTDRRVVVVAQPHRYTRLKSLFEDFVDCFSEAHKLYIMEVYPAGEKKIEGFSGEKLCRAIAKKYGNDFVCFAPKAENVKMELKKEIKENDIVLFLGAGDIWKLAKDFNKEMERHQ